MEESINKTRPADDAVNPIHYLIILARHSRRIIVTSMVVTVVVYLSFFFSPNKYQAKARILPPQQNMTLSGQILEHMGGRSTSFPGTGSGSMGGMAASMLGLVSPSELYVSILTGDTILDRIITRFDLMKLYKSKYIEDARKILAYNVKITTGKKDSLITIAVTSETPDQAAEIANAFTEELDRLLKEITLQETKERMVFLENERLQTSRNLQKTEETLRSFSEKNSVLQIDTQTKGVLEHIARIRADIDSKEVSLQVLRQQATPMNPDMIRSETELKGLKEKLRSAETQYDNCLSDVCLPANKTPGLALEYIRLYREVKFQEGLYQLYIKLVEIARMDMARDTTVIETVDKAKPSQRRINKRLFPSMIAGVLTCFLMIGWILGRDLVRNIKISEDNINQLTILKDSLEPWPGRLKRMKRTILRFIRR